MSVQTEVILIHGTWAHDATWVSPDSTLARKIQANVAGAVVEEPFRWSGRNRFADRKEAAVKLIDRLRAVPPNRRVFLVAHSHGGSVAHYAYQLAPDAFACVAGVACMATPFFGFSVRPGYVALFAAMALALLVLVMHALMSALMYGVSAVYRNFAEGVTGPLILAAMGSAALIALAVVLFRDRDRMLAALVQSIDPVLALDTTTIQMPRCCYFRSSADEVALGLNTGQFLTTVANRLIGVLARVAQYLVARLSAAWQTSWGRMLLGLFAVFLALAAAVPAAIQISLGLTPSDWKTFLWVFSGAASCGIDGYPALGLAFCAVWQLAMWVDMAVAGLSLVLFVAFALGWLVAYLILGLLGCWNAKAALALEFAIEPTPEGWKDFYSGGWSRDPGALREERPVLQHSDPYSSPTAQAALCDWMNKVVR